jgi:hypothetical protein
MSTPKPQRPGKPRQSSKRVEAATKNLRRLIKADRQTPRTGPNLLLKSAVRERILASLAKVNKSEAGYFYGFLDPAHADRGPIRNCIDPTVVIRLTSKTAFSVVSGANVHNNYPSAPVLVNTNANDNIGIVCSPMLVNQIEGPAGNLYHLASGTFFDPAYPLETAAMYHDGVGGWTPLNQYSIGDAFPGMTLNSDEDIGARLNGNCSLPWRVVGLRATLTHTTAAIAAQGSCMAFDNSEIFGYTGQEEMFESPPNNGVRPMIAGATTPGMITNTPFLSVPIGDGQSIATSTPAYPLTPGVTIESNFLPSSPKVTDYISRLFFYRTDGGLPAIPEMNMGTHLLNVPAACFILQGLSPGVSSFVLEQTLAIEIQVRQLSPLAMLINEARFAVGYSPDFGVLSGLPRGGKLGYSLEVHILRGGALGHGAIGYRAAVAGKSLVETRLPPSGPNGALPATEIQKDKSVGDQIKDFATEEVLPYVKDLAAGGLKSLADLVKNEASTLIPKMLGL